MRSKIVIITAACLVFATALPALAQSSRLYFASYLGLSVGSNRDFSSTSPPVQGTAAYSNAPSFAGALGLRFNDHFRVEEELSYRKPKFDHVSLVNGGGEDSAGGSLRSIFLMTNLYYDFNLKWHDIQPFISAGLGVAQHHGDLQDEGGLGLSSSGTSTTLAYQLGTGLKYRVNPDLAFTGGYRFLGSGEAKIGNDKINYNTHEIRLGVEYDIPVHRVK